MSEPKHLSTYPTYLFYFSTYQLYFCFTLLLAWCCFITSFFDICDPWEPISALQGGGGRITQPPKSDFLTTLEFNQISDPKFDASEVIFGPLWSSKSITFRTLKSTFHENADLTDILIFFNIKSRFWSPEELSRPPKSQSKTC